MTQLIAPTTGLRLRTLAREQAVVVAGQLGAGAGNLLYALAAARVLDPGDFADVATFLAAFLLLSLPTAGLSAGAAVGRGGARHRRVRTLGWSLGVAVLIATAAPVLAPLLGLPLSMAMLLAVSCPGAALLAVERGQLYGEARHGAVVASLVAEPTLRLTVGVMLAMTFGAPGAAAGVVIGSYVALSVAWRNDLGRDLELTPTGPRSRPLRWATASFVLVAILQNQDLLLAAHLLPAGELSRFAALSTLGGLAAFATATVPLVLLPRAGEHGRALPVALGTAGVLGLGAVSVFLVGGRPAVELLFGARYGVVAPMAAAYVLGMALLGISRVLIADGLVRGLGARLVLALAAMVPVHAALIVMFDASAATVARATVGSMMLLTAAVTAVSFVPTRTMPRTRLRFRVHLDATVAKVAGLTGVALVLRLLVFRGIWVDEAISIRQAQMPFGAMLHQLSTTDVHPPLHASVLWAVVRLFGTSELAVRLPSIIAGTALIPLLYVTGRELYDRRTGMIAAGLGTVAPLSVWYSQEARMYALYMLFALGAILGQIRAVRTQRFRDWALYGASTVLLVYTQYLGALQIVTQLAVFAVIVVRRRDDRADMLRTLRSWALTTALMVVALAPLLPYLSAQWATYQAHGAGLESVPSQTGSSLAALPGFSIYTVIANFIWALGGYHSNVLMAQIGGLWPLAMLAALMLLGRRIATSTRYLVAMVAGPALMLLAVGLVRPDLFEVRYVAGVVPVLSLLAARGLTSLAPSRMALRIGTCALVFVLLAGLADQQFNGTNPRLYDFRGALRSVEQRMGPHDEIIYAPQYLDAVIDYYLPSRPAVPISASASKWTGARRIFVVASFLDHRDIAGRTGALLGKLGKERHLIVKLRDPQVRVWVFR